MGAGMKVYKFVLICLEEIVLHTVELGNYWSGK
jgi:hypothetical protein